jgi:ATP-dependent Lon protease
MQSLYAAIPPATATWAATLQNVDIDLGVFLIGELTLTGHLPAAGDMQAKLLAAAEFVDAMRYEKGYVIFPMANVAGLQVVEANGEDVKLPRRLRDKLVLLPAERELDALKMLFGDRFSAYA